MNKPIKITAILWDSYLPPFLEASRMLPHIDLAVFSHKEIENNVDTLELFFREAEGADAIFFYWTSDGFWDEVDVRMSDIAGDKVVVTTSFDPVNWGRAATVDMAVCSLAYQYLAEGGKENYRRLLQFLAHHVDVSIPVEEPVPLPWQGLIHPPAKETYDTLSEYLTAHPWQHEHTVGVLFSRATLTNSDGALEQALIAALESKGLNVLPVFSHGTPDKDVGSLGPLGSAEHYYINEDGKPTIKALINMHYFFLGRDAARQTSEPSVAGQTVAFFTRLGVPVLKPVIAYSKTRVEWEEDPQGLTSEVSFGIAMPEFEGNIEPMIMACSRKISDESSGAAYDVRELISERIDRVAERVRRWVDLSIIPPCERKVVFVLHKNECAGLEANVGGAAGLNTGNSIIHLMHKMKEEGYNVENMPESGEDLMHTFLARKAIAEFRWTTVDEIISKNGHLALLERDIYQQWFDALPEKAKNDQIEAWGEPPGQKMNGVPPSMVFEDKLVITGLNFGNVNVIMQPKRGCAGPRCDGKVCKILHDPDIPPPHQYIATYMYMNRVFGAHVVIHVGTHGNLEWMPGKGAGLSDCCWPDIAIGTVPHLYIYNSDNPAEGVVAKRRSYATLVDHMQAMMTTSDTYDELKDLEDLLNDYHRAKDLDPARSHQLMHLIEEAIDTSNFRSEINAREPVGFEEVTVICHELLSSVRNSQTRIGMHVFGEVPDDEKCYEYINTILRFDSNNELNTRRLVFDLWGEDITIALENPGQRNKNGKAYGDLLFDADRKAMDMIQGILTLNSLDETLEREFSMGTPALLPKDLYARLVRFNDLVKDVYRRIISSREDEALLNAMNGGHVPAGPSGFISRGRWDILPTGRNFYNVDPTRIPTKAAHRVGVKLADALLTRHLNEEDRYPETVGMVWLASDIMRADGEQIGQILHLMGAQPRWKANGQINGFNIIPLSELGRPRVDINIRVSGITRDCFPDAVKYVDQAVMAIGALDEPEDRNFIRRHLIERAQDKEMSLTNPEDFRKLSYRIFCAQPGVYKAGVNLAVYASAWKEEKDLSDVYVFWNGYAYGGGAGDASYGVSAHQELVDNLKKVEVTFDKHISDESDFLNCCGFYSNYGGMTVAAKSLSGKMPKTYYGDTRDPARVSVTDFADELRRVVRAKLLNPKYIEGMKENGYQGAGELNKRIGRVYGYGATTGKVDDWIFDEITKTFMLDPAMKEWFQKVNPWALEEIGRRLMEAQARGIWKPDEEIFEQLKEAYLETEAVLEDTLDGVTGDFQGGSVDIMTSDDVESWASNMKDVLGKIR